jgi:hypothetical protein
MNRSLLSIAFLALALSAGLFWFVSLPPGSNWQGGACTMEALLCPDGTAVGRQGTECKFTACPNHQEFTGRFIQEQGNYYLVLDTARLLPENYRIPLELQVSNVVGQLIGQEIRVRGTFTEGSRLRVETIEQIAPEAAIPDSATLSIGETKTINGLKVTLNKVVADSRCAVDVQCIWAGNLTANVTLVADTGRTTVDLVSDKPAHPFGTRKISIVNVAPSNVASHPTEPSAYRITFKVESLISPSGSGVTGRVTLTPTCPVEQNPSETRCAPQGYATTVAIRKSGTTAILVSAKSDASGSFRADLAPGSYQLSALGGQVYPRCEAVTMKVSEGQYAAADISCDSGIR